MFTFPSIIVGLARMLNSLTGIYEWLIIISAFISWFSPSPYNPLVRFLNAVTEPVLNPVRRLMSRFSSSLGIDFSPIIVILFLEYIVRGIVIKSLYLLI